MASSSFVSTVVVVGGIFGVSTAVQLARQVVEAGTPEAIFGNLQSSLLQRFLAEVL
ncbi:hypothetical protein OE766_22645 [Pararhizobium sp. YC-54]|uniref:hypothetical protein n=1 Tax=Pararhizobium sp. YC-54 TaxID=2986920 RepID=UPI0021F7F7BB|nr:hypothetical protein [Pararhizobium sp. YC-54]MCW0001035.1 hypothetical protein [Pararhizobium sp. YC-54]